MIRKGTFDKLIACLTECIGENKKKSGRPAVAVKQYDEYGVLLDWFHSAKEAEKETGIKADAIKSCCRGEQQSLNEKLIKIFNHFGIQTQNEKLIEELDELVEAIEEYLIYGEIEPVIKEVIDVMIVSSQIAIVKGGMNTEQIKAILHQKIDRTLEIIAEMQKTGKSYENIRKKMI
jgi:NTP pyrophosphatase (non-canonical NTP hydrolase)